MSEWLTPERAALAAEWRDLARLELVNGRRVVAAQAHPLAVLVRRDLALHYRRRARAAAHLAASSTVWDDPELLDAIAQGRTAVAAMLATEADEVRRAVLELALSILDELAQVFALELEAVDTGNEPTAVECAHPRRRRRAGPCLQRPHLVHARQGDDPYPPRAESSQACGANSPRLSSNPGGSR